MCQSTSTALLQMSCTPLLLTFRYSKLLKYIASIFSCGIALGRPQIRSRFFAAARPALTRSCINERSN
nr:hypothetical protein [Sulfuricurvum sp.]